jgi:osmotically-inducible protein OsmY
VKNLNNRNDPEISQMSIGAASGGYKNIIESDEDISIDIQDTIGRDVTLSLVADNIHVRVAGEIVTLEGEVFREEEKITAGDIATARVGYDKVNNYLGVTRDKESKNTTRRIPW